MRVLRNVKPTREQLPILNYRPGFVLIRGSAGSGKTTTAVLRLQVVTGVWRRERQRVGDDTPVRVLVLTFNRTLRGYVEELVRSQLQGEKLDLTLATFARWAMDSLGDIALDEAATRRMITLLGSGLGYADDFLADEVAYVLGRFLPGQLQDYANPEARQTYERTGRGGTPRMERQQRERLLNDVIWPYLAWKEDEGIADWTDLPVRLLSSTAQKQFDIVLVDEAQDFSANQVRGVVHHLARQHSTAFVLDAVQRIYPHAFTWREVGVDVGNSSFRLRDNHRNTREVAAFARPLVDGLPIDDDGTLPDLETCTRTGQRPRVVRGLFSAQMDWLLNYLDELPPEESVAFLHPRGGRYLDYARRRLREAGIQFVEMQGRAEWPQGPEQVGLSTLHSAKGLEFDHVVILGLNADLLPLDSEERDAELEMHRRIVAMAIARARESVVVTFKPEEAARVLAFLDPATFEAIDVT